MQGQGVVEMNDPKNYNGGKGNLVWSMTHSASKRQMRHLRDGSGKWVVREDVKTLHENECIGPSWCAHALREPARAEPRSRPSPSV